MTDTVTGQFQVTTANGMHLVVTATGFSTMEIVVPLAAADFIDLGLIELAPLGTFAISVLDSDGQPSPLADIYAIQQAESADGTVPEARRRIGVTDELGRSWASISHEVILFAEKGDRVSLPKLAVPTDAGLVLQLPAFKGTLLGVRKESPVANLPLQLTKQDDYPWIRYKRNTTIEGTLAEPIPPGEYFVESLDPSLELTGHVAARFGRPLVSVSVGGPEVVWIDGRDARSSTRLITLVDEETHQPLAGASGWIASYEVPPFADPPSWVALGVPIKAPDGGPSLQLGLFPMMEDQEGLRLYVSAPGYQPSFIEKAVIEATSARHPLEVPLSKAGTCSLRLTDANGQGFRHTVYVRGTHRGLESGPHLPVDGRIAFPCTGDAVVLLLGPHEHSQVVVELSSDQLRSDELLTVALKDLGAITVEDVREPASEMWCGDGRGFYCEPLYRSDKLVFDQLPPGRYDIGPRGKIDGLAYAIAREMLLPIAVGPSENVVVGWNAEWTFQPFIEGKVTCVGIDPAELFVVPFFASHGIPITTGERARRYPVGADGIYRVNGIEGIPNVIVLARKLVGGALWPVGVLDSDGNGSVACSSVTLRIENASDDDRMVVTVRAKIDGHSVSGIALFERIGPGLLELGPLPIGIGQLELSGGRIGRKRIDIELKAGVEHFVRVDAGVPR